MENKINEKCKITNTELIGNYENIKTGTIIKIRDVNFGYIKEMKAYDFLKSKKIDYVTKYNKYSIENIKLYLKHNMSNLTLISKEYIGSGSYLIVKCEKHGEYKSTWGNLKAGYNCLKCAAEKRGLQKRKNIEDVRKLFLENGWTLIDNEYKNETQKLTCVNEIGYKIYTCYRDFNENKSSFVFSSKNKYTIDNMRIFLDNNNMSHFKILSKEFKSSHSKIKFYCEKHDYEFEATWNNLSKGKGCFYCGAEKRNQYVMKNYHLIPEDIRIKKRFRTKQGSYAIWRKSVFERDNYTCCNCGKRGDILNAHHLNGYNWFEDGRLDINNGVTLCKKCHDNFHKIYGKGNNTEKQFIEFICK